MNKNRCAKSKKTIKDMIKEKTRLYRRIARVKKEATISPDEYSSSAGYGGWGQDE